MGARMLISSSPLLLFPVGCCALMQVWSYDPATRSSRLESGRTNRMLMRRYATVEKAKDADVIGILVGTLGVGALPPAAPVWGSVSIARLTMHMHSRLFASDYALAATDRGAPKEELHGRGRQTQPGKVGQLYRGRVLCPRRVPRKLDGRFKGTYACRVPLFPLAREICPVAEPPDMGLSFAGVPASDRHPVRARTRVDVESLDR